MVASLLRVLHSGIQDLRLLPPKGNPQIELFQKVLIRAGRFTTAFVRLDFDTIPTLGNVATLSIPKKGHLVSRLYLVTTMPDIGTPQKNARQFSVNSGKSFAGPTFGWTNSLGHALIQDASIEIGGARIDRLDGRLLEVMDEFYTPLEKVSSMNSLLPRKENGFSVGCFGIDDGISVAVTPLPFWFSCGDPGAYLPIDAIQADKVLLRIGFQSIDNLYVSSTQEGNVISADTTETTLQNGSIVEKREIRCAGGTYSTITNSPFYYTDTVNGKLIVGFKERMSAIPGIQMPASFPLGDTYVIAEYIYLDRPEANRFRVADIRVPVVQHYPFQPVDTQAAPKIQIPIKVPNPTRALFFYCNRREAGTLNAPFLATRDLSEVGSTSLWWPDAVSYSKSAFSTRESEPLSQIALVYEGKLVRYWTDAPSMFRSLIPSLEMRKSPWVNRYFYTLGFGFRNGHMPPSLPTGEANLDKFSHIELALEFHPNRGSINPTDVPRYNVYVWAETYNVLRIYGGRAGLLFAY